MKKPNTAKKTLPQRSKVEQERMAGLPLDRSTMSLLKLLIARHWLEAHTLVYKLAPEDETGGLFHQMARVWERLGIQYARLSPEKQHLVKRELQWYLERTTRHGIPVDDHFVREVIASADQGIPMDRLEWKDMLEGDNGPTRRALKAIAQSG